MLDDGVFAAWEDQVEINTLGEQVVPWTAADDRHILPFLRQCHIPLTMRPRNRGDVAPISAGSIILAHDPRDNIVLIPLWAAVAINLPINLKGPRVKLIRKIAADPDLQAVMMAAYRLTGSTRDALDALTK